MAKARRIYFRLLCAAIALFGFANWLPHGASEVGSTGGLVRFLVFFVAIGSAIGTWGTAVMMASVHKVVWPLVTTTLLVLVALVIAGSQL